MKLLFVSSCLLLSHHIAVAFTVATYTKFTLTPSLHQQQGQQHGYGVKLYATKENESASKNQDEDEEEVTGHQVVAPKLEIDPKEAERLNRLQEAFQDHQQNAPKLDWPTEVRSLVEYNHGYCVMSTMSASSPGYPGGSVTAFAPSEETGEPLFLLSKLASHRQDLMENSKCSVTIASKEFKSAADGRVNLMGTCTMLSREDDAEKIAKAKEIYLKKHPNSAFWIDFGDFDWYQLNVEKIRFVGGFARVGAISADQYKASKPDPIAAFAAPVAKHMNEDHKDATIAMVQTVPGVILDDEKESIADAEIVSIDSLGMYVKVTKETDIPPKQFKLRLPFPRPATDRQDLRTIIVEMTQEAAAAGEKKDSSE